MIGKAPITVTYTIGFHIDGIEVWKEWDDYGKLMHDLDSFTFRVRGNQILFRYVSQLG